MKKYTSKKQAMQLPIHRASGNYRKCIGLYLAPDGTAKPKIWYFDGNDFAGALTKIGELKTRWEALLASGKKFWDEDPIYSAERLHIPASATGGKKGVMTLAAGLGHYVSHLKKQLDGGQCKASHYTSQKNRVQFLTRLQLDEHRTFGAVPLPAVNRNQLESVVLKICNRPEVTRHHYQGAAEKFQKVGEKVPVTKMSGVYAKALKSTLKNALEWLVEEKLWSICSHWKAIWKTAVVTTEEELVQSLEQIADGGEVDHFDLDELKKIWLATEDTLKPEFWKTTICLALNCGFANEEIASLKLLEVKEGLRQPFTIERYRGKTLKRAKQNAYGKWTLWTETAEHLFQAAGGNPHVKNDEDKISYNGPMLTSDNGTKLTENNTIGQGWRRLVASAEVRPLSFKYLRKTAAHFVRTELGFSREIADMLLSHSEGGIMSSYAGRDWEQLREATDAMREYLKPMFDQKPKEDKKAGHMEMKPEKKPIMKLAV